MPTRDNLDNDFAAGLAVGVFAGLILATGFVLAVLVLL